MARILVLEDDPDQAMLFARVLELAGYETRSAPNVESAITLTREQAFDVALVDWDLPGIKGDAYILMAKVEYPTLKTVLFSNHANVEQAAKACGADAWMLKMSGITRLREIVADLLCLQ